MIYIECNIYNNIYIIYMIYIIFSIFFWSGKVLFFGGPEEVRADDVSPRLILLKLVNVKQWLGTSGGAVGIINK